MSLINLCFHSFSALVLLFLVCYQVYQQKLLKWLRFGFAESDFFTVCNPKKFLFYFSRALQIPFIVSQKPSKNIKETLQSLYMQTNLKKIKAKSLFDCYRNYGIIQMNWNPFIGLLTLTLKHSHSLENKDKEKLEQLLADNLNFKVQIKK